MAALALDLHRLLLTGTVIPAHPLALTPDLQLDVRHQRALTRYYCAAGVGGLAVGVHTTQFEIHDPELNLLKPVLQLAAETVDQALAASPRPFVKIAGLVGKTDQALGEAMLALSLGYHAGLLSLSAFREADDETLLGHCCRISREIPIVGFYLQPAVGGRVLGYDFWRRFVEIDNVVAIKVAPFNRYQTIDVARAVVDAGRQDDIALYTGNDDSILYDLVTDFHLTPNGKPVHFVGGLLGQWAVWTRRVVETLEAIHTQRANGQIDYGHWLSYGVQVTDANAAIFDATHDYRGCIPGIHWVLQQQGFMQNTCTLNPHEQLAPGQVDEIRRVHAAYPALNDDAFVAAHLQEWLDG
jgi:dihydrodipicolinate synthase/N-acetylneuraminate lyase